MKNAPPAFQFYASDWLGSTRIALMTPEQEGVYIRLLAHAWADDDCSLPADDRSLALLSRLGARWRKVGRAILDCFETHPERPDRLINRKLWDVRQYVYERRARGANGGKRSADVRWGDKQDGKQGRKHSGKQTDKQEGNKPGKGNVTLQSPVSNFHKKEISGFAEFWAAYPRKRKRPQAEQAWRRQDLTADDLPAVLAAMETIAVCGDPAELTGDGIIDGADLAVVLGNWGPCPPQ